MSSKACWAASPPFLAQMPLQRFEPNGVIDGGESKWARTMGEWPFKAPRAKLSLDEANT